MPITSLTGPSSFTQLYQHYTKGDGKDVWSTKTLRSDPTASAMTLTSKTIYTHTGVSGMGQKAAAARADKFVAGAEVIKQLLISEFQGDDGSASSVLGRAGERLKKDFMTKGITKGDLKTINEEFERQKIMDAFKAVSFQSSMLETFSSVPSMRDFLTSPVTLKSTEFMSYQENLSAIGIFGILAKVESEGQITRKDVDDLNAMFKADGGIEGAIFHINYVDVGLNDDVDRISLSDDQRAKIAGGIFLTFVNKSTQTGTYWNLIATRDHSFTALTDRFNELFEPVGDFADFDSALGWKLKTDLPEEGKSLQITNFLKELEQAYIVGTQSKPVISEMIKLYEKWEKSL